MLISSQEQLPGDDCLQFSEGLEFFLVFFIRTFFEGIFKESYTWPAHLFSESLWIYLRLYCETAVTIWGRKLRKQQ